MRYRMILATLLVATSVFASARVSGGSAEEMLAAIDAVKMPTFDRTKVNDTTYRAQYQKDYTAAMTEKTKMIWDFYKQYPTNDKTPDLLNQRWGFMLNSSENAKDLQKGEVEVNQVLAAFPSPGLEKTATYWAAQYLVYDDEAKAADKYAAADKFATKYKDDQRSFGLLSEAAETLNDKDLKLKIYKRLVADYPTARGEKYIPGKIKQAEGIGKPFNLTFTDAVSGQAVDLQSFKGKVVVVDFWATWCGPCRADLPKVRDIYKKYHDQGVEYVSVSLDLPKSDDPAKDGLTKLKDFVAANDMPWHHYYQGNYWDSEFSTSWGINAIPCVFLVDKNGNLADVEAREHLEAGIQKLLKG